MTGIVQARMVSVGYTPADKLLMLRKAKTQKYKQIAKICMFALLACTATWIYGYACFCFEARKVHQEQINQSLKKLLDATLKRQAQIGRAIP